LISFSDSWSEQEDYPIVGIFVEACVLEQGVSWAECLLLIELTYNNNFHSSISMTLFDALYGRRCRMPCWNKMCLTLPP